MVPTLSLRAVSRATLDRQLLLRRHPLPALRAVRRLADLTSLVAETTAALSVSPMTRAQLAKVLAPRWPDADPMALAYATTYLVPVVQVPPRGIWGKSAQATWLAADAWLAPLRLREVAERLDLRTYHGPGGTELLDLPGIPLPDEDVQAPPRFLPEFDNLLLSHADRRRVIPRDHPVPLWPGNGGSQGTLLIDGIWDATWKMTKSVLTISSFRDLTAQEKADIADEGARLLAFAAPAGTKTPDIRFAAA